MPASLLFRRKADLPRLLGGGDFAERAFVFLEVVLEGGDHALEMSRRNDDARIKRASRREHVQKIHHELLTRMLNLHGIRVDAAHDGIVGFDLNLGLLWLHRPQAHQSLQPPCPPQQQPSSADGATAGVVESAGTALSFLSRQQAPSCFSFSDLSLEQQVINWE